jgi:predicted SprT family Zn-dependent metalloprotease
MKGGFMQAAQEQDIRHWILHACHFNGVPEIVNKIKYKFNTIVISSQLWERASTLDRRQLIIHETCHIISHYKFGENIEGHGKEWKQCMVKSGLKPDRFHHVNRDGLKRVYVKYEIECNCSKVWIGHGKAAQVRKNILWCSVCKGQVKLTGQEHRA